MSVAAHLLALGGSLLLAAGLAADLPRLLRRHSRRLHAVGVRASLRPFLEGAALGVVLAGASWLILALPILSVLAGIAGLAAPTMRRRARAARTAREADRAWGAALDQLADGLAAGLAFPAAANAVAQSGPAALAGAFASLVEQARRGDLELGLDALATAPGASSRPVAALLRASQLELPTGGLAPLLRELARVARERFAAGERARAKAQALQREATILAASPVAFLALIGWSSPGYLAAYRTPAGTLVSLGGALAIAACYLAMRRLGRIPTPGGTR